MVLWMAPPAMAGAASGGRAQEEMGTLRQQMEEQQDLLQEVVVAAQVGELTSITELSLNCPTVFSAEHACSTLQQ